MYIYIYTCYNTYMYIYIYIHINTYYILMCSSACQRTGLSRQGGTERTTQPFVKVDSMFVELNNEMIDAHVFDRFQMNIEMVS